MLNTEAVIVNLWRPAMKALEISFEAHQISWPEAKETADESHVHKP